MDKRADFSYEIQYTKVTDKFLKDYDTLLAGPRGDVYKKMSGLK